MTGNNWLAACIQLRRAIAGKSDVMSKADAVRQVETYNRMFALLRGSRDDDSPFMERFEDDDSKGQPINTIQNENDKKLDDESFDVLLEYEYALWMFYFYIDSGPMRTAFENGNPLCKDNPEATMILKISDYWKQRIRDEHIEDMIEKVHDRPNKHVVKLKPKRGQQRQYTDRRDEEIMDFLLRLQAAGVPVVNSLNAVPLDTDGPRETLKREDGVSRAARLTFASKGSVRRNVWELRKDAVRHDPIPDQHEDISKETIQAIADNLRLLRRNKK